ncbi:MAG: hypothetical protein WC371_01010 [Parachlamydiales bacterium]|jgi:hypothetical protein
MNEEKKYLTHERLNHKFVSNFDLINYAIKLARLHIHEQMPKHLTEIIEELELLPELAK